MYINKLDPVSLGEYGTANAVEVKWLTEEVLHMCFEEHGTVNYRNYNEVDSQYPVEQPILKRMLATLAVEKSGVNSTGERRLPVDTHVRAEPYHIVVTVAWIEFNQDEQQQDD